MPWCAIFGRWPRLHDALCASYEWDDECHVFLCTYWKRRSMNHARPCQKVSPLTHRLGSMQEKWITHEGLLVTALVVSLVLLALLKQLVMPSVRH